MVTGKRLKSQVSRFRSQVSGFRFQVPGLKSKGSHLGVTFGVNEVST